MFNNRINTIIVDDEKHCRDFLEKSVREHCPEIAVLEKCQTFSEAMLSVKLHSPDLVFIDVEMPEGNGFDLLEKLGEYTFAVVFTTAHRQYAIQALRINAVDYLLKPVIPEELKLAVTRVKAYLENPVEAQEKNYSTGQEKGLHRIAFPTANGLTFANPDHIIRCEADGAYTKIYFENSQLIVSKNIKILEDALLRFGFFRVHKSHLINLSHLTEYIKGNGGIAVMTDGSHVEVAKRKRESFLLAVV